MVSYKDWSENESKPNPKEILGKIFRQSEEID